MYNICGTVFKKVFNSHNILDGTGQCCWFKFEEKIKNYVQLGVNENEAGSYSL